MKRLTTLSELNENECYYLTERIPYHKGGGIMDFSYEHQPFYLREKTSIGLEVTMLSIPVLFNNFSKIGTDKKEFVNVFIPLEYAHIDTHYEPSKNSRSMIITDPNPKEKEDLLAMFVTLRIVDGIKYREPDKRKRHQKATFGHYKLP